VPRLCTLGGLTRCACGRRNAAQQVSPAREVAVLASVLLYILGPIAKGKMTGAEGCGGPDLRSTVERHVRAKE
jgi:hypothetical protein